tara:strand:+ start:81 stop:548 length:468 start_codon:yes stop_codon:yes gene_type:complete
MSENADNPGIVTHPPVFYIVAILIGLGIDYFMPLSFGFEGMTKTVSLVILVLGTIVTVLGFKMFTTDKQSPSVHEPTVAVYQSGIYAYSRNPIYLGVLLWMMAGALFFDKVWIMIMVLPLILWMNKVVIEKEEAYLEEKFGDSYLDYKKKVRRWI